MRTVESFEDELLRIFRHGDGDVMQIALLLM